jgi:hypothetical protein
MLLSSCNKEFVGVEVKWEGAGSRIVAYRVFVQVEKITDLPEEISPSIAEYISKPVRVTVKVINGDIFEVGRILSIVLSHYDIKDIDEKATVVIGLLPEKIAICIEKADAESWASACMEPYSPPKLNIDELLMPFQGE